MPAIIGALFLGSSLWLQRSTSSLGFVWEEDIDECDVLSKSLRPTCPDLFACRNKMREAISTYKGPPGKHARDVMTSLTIAIRKNPACKE